MPCAPLRRANGEVRTSTARPSPFSGGGGSWLGTATFCEGKLIFADGSMYEGQFESDRKHGTGKPASYNGADRMMCDLEPRLR